MRSQWGHSEVVIKFTQIHPFIFHHWSTFIIPILINIWYIYNPMVNSHSIEMIIPWYIPIVASEIPFSQNIYICMYRQYISHEIPMSDLPQNGERTRWAPQAIDHSVARRSERRCSSRGTTWVPLRNGRCSPGEMMGFMVNPSSDCLKNCDLMGFNHYFYGDLMVNIWISYDILMIS